VSAAEPDRAQALEKWLSPRLRADDLQVSALTRAGEGSSNETVVFTVTWSAGGKTGERRLVLRVQPSDHQLFLEPDAVREAAVVHEVGQTGSVPVPEVIGAESDPTIIGAPFFVMDYLEGRTLRDVPSMHAVGWLTELSVAERVHHYEAGLDALAAIARIDVAQGFDAVRRGSSGTPLQQLLDSVVAYYEWAAAGRDLGVITQAVAELQSNIPDHTDASLSWGDARPGNLLFAVSGDVAAVLDWEMAELAPAEVDLGWWLVTEDFYSAGLGVAMLEGVPDEAQTLRRWEELVGRPARALDYYKLLAALRYALVLVRARDINVGRGALGDDSTMHTHNPMTQTIARLLGAPVPSLSPEFAQMVASYAAKRDAASAESG
jgi:aminoglycoside phosphotransferase (APT) family kinase protein